jgi:hypothetical protein
MTHYRQDLLRDAASLQTFADAGIDPAFDADMDELERQFAEFRLTIDHQ